MAYRCRWRRRQVADPVAGVGDRSGGCWSESMRVGGGDAGEGRTCGAEPGVVGVGDVASGGRGAGRDARLTARPHGTRVTVASSQDSHGGCVRRDNGQYPLVRGVCRRAAGVSGS